MAPKKPVVRNKDKTRRESLLVGCGGWIASFIFIPLAMFCNCCVWIFATPLPVEWAIGVCMFSCGFIYCISPVNWIPNWVPILGKLDDLVIGWGGMALGAFFCYEADKQDKLPRDAMHLGPLAAGAAVLLLSAIWKGFRETALGLISMVLTPFIASMFLETNLAIAVSLLVCGFIYIQLPWDLIPDRWPVIGRLDDMIFGWGFMIAGATILYMTQDPAAIQAMMHHVVQGIKQAAAGKGKEL